MPLIIHTNHDERINGEDIDYLFYNEFSNLEKKITKEFETLV